MINLEYLHEFCMVARMKSITKAAEYLFVSQPTLSRHLSDLELLLDSKLIEHGNSKSFKLTPAGEMLFRDGERLLKDVETMEQHVKQMSSGGAGILRLQCRLFINNDWAKLLCDFCKEYEHIELHYWDRPNETLIHSILKDYTDIAIAYDYEIWQHKDNFNVLPLWQEQFVALVSPYSALAELDSVSISKLKHETMILSSISDTGAYDEGPLHQVLSIFEGNSISVPSPTSMALQTTLGEGFCIVPYSRAMSYPMLKALPLEDLECPTTCYLISDKYNRNPCTDILFNYVKTHHCPDKNFS